MIGLVLLLSLVAGAVLAIGSSSAAVRVESLGGLAKRVTVDGRGYLVLRFGGGAYSVTSMADPGTSLALSQSGEIASSGNTAQLRADMARFPAALFGGAA